MTVQERMGSDDIGDRFKAYESVSDYALPRRLPLVIRVDGRAFHSLKLEKPFDSTLWHAMGQAAIALCSEVQGSVLAYQQSDEISVIARDDFGTQTQPWVGKRLSKILSLSASIATATFGEAWGDTVNFDARAFVLPDLDEVQNYLIWRQQDATRNSVSMAARAVFSHKALDGKDSRVMLDMLREAGKPWEAHPEHFRRGSLFRQVVMEKAIPERGIVVPRRTWLHFAPPVFTQDRNYIPMLWDERARAAVA